MIHVCHVTRSKLVRQATRQLIKIQAERRTWSEHCSKPFPYALDRNHLSSLPK